MSRLGLLLVLSATSLPPLNSFLSPTTAGKSLDLRRRTRGLAWSTDQATRSRVRANLPKDWRWLSTPRRCTPSNRKTSRHLLEDVHEDAGSDTEPESGMPVPTSKGQKQGRRRKRRLRDHVPVDEAETSPAQANDSAGDDQPVVFDGSWQGDGQFATSDEVSTPVKEPTFEDRMKFQKVMEELLNTEKEEDLPSRLTPHINFLLSVNVPSLTNELIRQEPTTSRIRTLRNAYEFIVTFLEEVVENTLELQTEHRNLLREIIEVAKVGPTEFDTKIRKLQDRFTYEFVKYLDSEVERLEKGNRSPGPGGGSEVLNVIKIVRTRVCAQVDLTMGEDVALLTRLLSYDDRYMMRAALRAVIAGKKPPEILSFRKLVDMTLKDVEAMQGVDPLLHRKLIDIVNDVMLLAKEAIKTRETIAAENAED